MSENKDQHKHQPWTTKRIILTALAVAAVIVVCTAVIFLLYSLTFLLFLCVLSIFLAYLLDPLVRAIRKPFVVRNLDRFMPRTVAILISYLLVFSCLVLILLYVYPLIAAEISEFAVNLQGYSTQFQSRFREFNESYRARVFSKELQESIGNYISSSVENFGGFLTLAIGSSAFTFVTYLPWIVLIPVLTFFFLKDAASLRQMFLSCFPSGTWRAKVDSLVSDVNTTLAAYTRAQLISCVFIGLVCTLFFTLFGLKYSLLLGLFAGILEFIPLLGPLTIGFISVLVALLFGSPWQAFWTVVFLIALRIIHDYVTYPRIVREGVHLHPFAVILSVLAGEQIGGAAGVFLSIPIIALLTVFYRHLLRHSGRQGLFAGFKSEEPELAANEE